MSQSPADKLLAAPADLDPFARDLRRLDDALSGRVHADPENVERGLAAETVERLGSTLMALEGRMEELKEIFGLDDEDLNLDLGPLGRLL
jgi:Gas vesicle protein K